MTTEQLHAYTNLVVATLVLAGLGVVFLLAGSLDYIGDRDVRGPALTVIALGVAVWLATRVTIRMVKGPGGVDERDRAVAHGALRAQNVVTQVLLLVLAVLFIESYEAAGAVPLSAPFLIWLAVTLLSLVVQGLATVIGYRRLG